MENVIAALPLGWVIVFGAVWVSLSIILWAWVSRLMPEEISIEFAPFPDPEEGKVLYCEHCHNWIDMLFEGACGNCFAETGQIQIVLPKKRKR